MRMIWYYDITSSLCQYLLKNILPRPRMEIRIAYQVKLMKRKWAGVTKTCRILISTVHKYLEKIIKWIQGWARICFLWHIIAVPRRRLYFAFQIFEMVAETHATAVGPNHSKTTTLTLNWVREESQKRASLPELSLRLYYFWTLHL